MPGAGKSRARYEEIWAQMAGARVLCWAAGGAGNDAGRIETDSGLEVGELSLVTGRIKAAAGARDPESLSGGSRRRFGYPSVKCRFIASMHVFRLENPPIIYPVDEARSRLNKRPHVTI